MSEMLLIGFTYALICEVLLVPYFLSNNVDPSQPSIVLYLCFILIRINTWLGYGHSGIFILLSTKKSLKHALTSCMHFTVLALGLLYKVVNSWKTDLGAKLAEKPAIVESDYSASVLNLRMNCITKYAVSG